MTTENKTRNELYDYCERIRANLENIYNGNEKNDDGETVTLWDYVNGDALDFEYTISSDGSYLGVRLYVTLGGPNIWVDTRNGEIAGAWGTDRANVWLPPKIAAALDVIFEECYFERIG